VTHRNDSDPLLDLPTLRASDSMSELIMHFLKAGGRALANSLKLSDSDGGVALGDGGICSLDGTLLTLTSADGEIVLRIDLEETDGFWETRD